MKLYIERGMMLCICCTWVVYSLLSKHFDVVDVIKYKTSSI